MFTIALNTLLQLNLYHVVVVIQEGHFYLKNFFVNPFVHMAVICHRNHVQYFQIFQIIYVLFNQNIS